MLLVVDWCFCFFFFNDTATTEIYTLSLHDALPICPGSAADLAERERVVRRRRVFTARRTRAARASTFAAPASPARSEEHTSELQSRLHLVCRLLLEKKKKNNNPDTRYTTLRDELRT